VTIEAIKAAIPHREPFLLLDEIVAQSDERIVCRKTFHGDEFWYQGHYPDYPITPGVLLCEAAMQAGAVLIAAQQTADPDLVPVVTRANNVQFRHMVLPGDTIEIEVALTERLASAFYLTARLKTSGKIALRMEFACTLAPRKGE
jgi:3-hydroxyacyl-[acyl-carrier-protein] dehydratase